MPPLCCLEWADLYIHATNNRLLSREIICLVASIRLFVCLCTLSCLNCLTSACRVQQRCQAGEHRKKDGQTNGQTLPEVLSCYTVDNEFVSCCQVKMTFMTLSKWASWWQQWLGTARALHTRSGSITHSEMSHLHLSKMKMLNLLGNISRYL